MNGRKGIGMGRSKEEGGGERGYRERRGTRGAERDGSLRASRSRDPVSIRNPRGPCPASCSCMGELQNRLRDKAYAARRMSRYLWVDKTGRNATCVRRQNRSQRDLREEAKRVALRPVPQPHTRLRDFSRPLRPRLYASIGACAKPGTFCLMRCGREAERLVFMRVRGAGRFVSLGAFGGAAICLTIS